MAQLDNFRLEDLSPLMDFDQFSLGTHNASQRILEQGLRTTEPQLATNFHSIYEEYKGAERIKIEGTLREGFPSEAVQQIFNDAFRQYSLLKQEYEGRPEFAFLEDPIHRKKFQVRPYEIKGKHLPPNPFLGATSAMDGIWPGYDKDEYFLEYPFLERYRGKDEKALHNFLKAHNLFYNLPETVSRYGVLFVPPPYLSDEMNLELRQHLGQCDTLWHTAPTVDQENTVAEVRLVLSYVEDDMPALVTDSGGAVIGVVTWADLNNRKDGEILKNFFKKDINFASEEIVQSNEKDSTERAQEAFKYMKKRNWQYMVDCSSGVPRIVTKTTSAVSYFLPPHQYKKGLGSAIYFGISDVKEGERLINLLNSQADGVPVALVETAHADTPYFRKILSYYRKRLQDVFMWAGTTVDPEASAEFIVRYGADGVKIGIAAGTACRTSRTGVRPPNADAGLRCGSVIAGLGYGMLDGWGAPEEFNMGLAMTGIQNRQGGGAFMGRREAANPTVRVNGARGKWYRGMAGADVQKAVWENGKKKNNKKEDEISDNEVAHAAHLHSEGAEVFVGGRSPSTVGRMLLSQLFLLQSAMSYQGVRADVPKEIYIPEPVLLQFHRNAKLHRIA